MTDSELLRRYASQRDSAAFAELTRRHLDFVYATARRLANSDTHTAEDITQEVFIDLARKAPALVDHPCLVGWLHACTRFNALNCLRRTRRRADREHEALAMNPPEANSTDWERIRPVIDEALEELDPRDRHFVLLRFFGQQSFAAIAQQFQVTENTVQKAVTRALDVLNAGLSRRGISSTSAALSVVLAQTATSAPTGLLAAIIRAALPALSTSATGTVAGMVGSALKLSGTLAAAAGLALGVGYWTGTQRQIAASFRETAEQDQRHRAEVQALQARLAEQKRRAAASDAEVSTLLTAIERARIEKKQLAAVPPPAPVPTNGPTSHTISRGDTGARIARSYGVSVADLVAANPGLNWARLAVGQVISLPPGAVPQAAAEAPPEPMPDLSNASVFSVRPGDTLPNIAAAARMSVDDLRRLNPDLPPGPLIAGQPIRLR